MTQPVVVKGKVFQVWTIAVHGAGQGPVHDRFLLEIAATRALLAQDKALKVVRALYVLATLPGSTLHAEVLGQAPVGSSKAFEGQVRTISASFKEQLT